MMMEAMVMQFQGIPVLLTTKAKMVYEGIINGKEDNLVKLIQASAATMYVNLEEVESVKYNPDFYQFTIVPAPKP